MLDRIKLIGLDFTRSLSHKVQKCANFSCNFVHSSQPQNRLCIRILKMLNRFQPNFRVYFISIKDMYGIPFQNIGYIFVIVSNSGNF